MLRNHAGFRPNFMFIEDHTDQRPTGDSSRSAHSQSAISSRFEQFEKRQGELWRLTLLVLFLLGLARSEEHTSELQSHVNLVCRLLLEKKKKNRIYFEQSKQTKKKEY